MADEKKENSTAPSKDGKQAIKKLELEMKTAFKDGKFDEVRKKAEELKKLDPQSHVAGRLIEKAEKAEKNEKKKQNAGKIKELEAKLTDAFKQGDVPKVSDLLDEIREMDPDNKKCTKIENHILKAKAALDKQVLKGKIKAMAEAAKPLLKDQKWDELIEKANEILKLEWNESFAMKALKQAAKAKKTDVAKLITVQEPPKAEKKPGFFAKLFKKKDKKAEAPAAKADAKTEKPVEPVPAKAEGSKTEGKEEKPAEAKPALSKAEEKPKEAEAKTEVKKEEKKPGFFAKLLKKKEKTGEKPQEAKAEEKKAKEKKGLFGMLKKKAETEEKKAPAPKTAAEKEAPKAQAAKPPTAPSPAAPKPVMPAKSAIAGGGMAAPLPSAAPKAPVMPAAPAAKPTQGVKPIAITPLAPATPAKSAVAGEGTVAKPAPAPAKAAAKPAAKGEKGNIFTSLFGKKESAAADEKKGKSIIDTIVDKSELVPELKKAPKKKVESTGEGFLKFSGAFLQFSIVFILISAGFFYVQNIDEENRVLALAGIDQNNASQLRSAANALDKKRDEKNDLNREIKRFQEGYVDKNIETIQAIVDARMDWPDIIAKLNEVTESVYEKNALLQYVQYSNYSYDVETGQLSTSATLSDPQGRNLTKLAEIEIAFRNYPRDPDNPDDDRKPYFYGFQEMNSFAKSFNKSTGRYLSTFSVNISTKEQKK